MRGWQEVEIGGIEGRNNPRICDELLEQGRMRNSIGVAEMRRATIFEESRSAP